MVNFFKKLGLVSLGAFGGALFLGSVVWLLTRLSFGPIPATGKLADGLSAAISLGFMSGGVGAFERVSRDAAVWQKRVSHALCVWIGATLWVVSGLTLVIVPFQVARGAAQAKQFPKPTWAFLGAQVVPVWLAGGWVLSLVYRATIAGREKTLLREAIAAISAVIWPRAADNLHDFRIETPLSPSEIRALFHEPSSVLAAPRRMWRNFAGDNTPKIIWKGDQIRVEARPGAPFDFQGRVESVEAGALITGRVKMPLILRVYSAIWFGFLLLFSLLAEPMLIFQPHVTKSHSDRLFMAVIVCGMWLFGLFYLRGQIWMARRHERALEGFFRTELQASQCDLTRRFDFWPWF